MKFELVKTSAPHRVYVVDGGAAVVHDTRKVNVSRQNIVDAALEAFKMTGSLGEQLGNGEGLMLQTEHLDHYVMASIDRDIAISSRSPMGKAKTRSITNAFLKEVKA